MRNPQPNREPKHTAIIGDTGSGKSQVIKNIVPGRGTRKIYWDINEDHGCKLAFNRMGDFLRALGHCNAKSIRDGGAGFSIAYTGDSSKKHLELFCKAVCQVLDGRYETYIICEELADATTNPGMAPPFLKRLLTQSRKFGGVFIAVTQRPQEIPKTVITQCKRIYVGQVADVDDLDMIARRSNMRDFRDQIKGLKSLEFMFNDRLDPHSPPKKVKMKYLG